jgi:hypothetical protein
MDATNDFLGVKEPERGRIFTINKPNTVEMFCFPSSHVFQIPTIPPNPEKFHTLRIY